MNEPPPAASTVAEVLRFEPVPTDQRGSRRAIVRWSDGTIGEAARWYDDEILLSEGDLIGLTDEEIRTKIFRRDRDYLQDDD